MMRLHDCQDLTQQQCINTIATGSANEPLHLLNDTNNYMIRYDMCIPIYIFPLADDEDKSSEVMLELFRMASNMALNPLLVIALLRRSTAVKLVS
jgi:hypothetical protein